MEQEKMRSMLICSKCSAAVLVGTIPVYNGKEMPPLCFECSQQIDGEVSNKAHFLIIQSKFKQELSEIFVKISELETAHKQLAHQLYDLNYERDSIQRKVQNLNRRFLEE